MFLNNKRTQSTLEEITSTTTIIIPKKNGRNRNNLSIQSSNKAGDLDKKEKKG